MTHPGSAVAMSAGENRIDQGTVLGLEGIIISLERLQKIPLRRPHRVFTESTEEGC